MLYTRQATLLILMLCAWSAPNCGAVADDLLRPQDTPPAMSWSSETPKLSIRPGYFRSSAQAPGAWLPENNTFPNDGRVPQDLVTGDWNRDGIQDLAIVYAYGDEIRWFMGRGDGTFLPGGARAVGIHPDPQDDLPRRVWAADFDGDGLVDLAVLCSGIPASVSSHLPTTPSFGILYGLPAGGFEPFQSVVIGPVDWTPATPQFATSLVVTPTDNDGGIEIAIGFLDSHQIALLQHHGGRHWDAPVVLDVDVKNITPTTKEPGPVELALADLDGDGTLDLMVLNRLELQVWRGIGPGTFGPPATLCSGAALAGLALADFNQDGAWDLAVSDYTANTIKVFLGLSAAGTAQQATSVPTPAGSGPARLARLDINNDGRDDLAVLFLQSGGGQILLGQNNLTAPLAPGPAFQTAALPWALTAGDFNRNGWTDLAIINEADLSDPSNNTLIDLSLLLNRTFPNPGESFDIRKDAGATLDMKSWLTHPRGLGWDAAGHALWTIDRLGQKLARLSETGEISGIYPTNILLASRQAPDDPGDLAIDDSGDLWVADRLGGRVEHAGNGGGMPSAKTGFATAPAGVSRPSGIAFDPGARRLLVADELQPVIAAFSLGGGQLASYTLASGQPLRDLAWDNDNGCLWGVSEAQPDQLVRLTLDDTNNTADAAGTIAVGDLAPVLQGQTIRSVAVDRDASLATPSNRFWVLTDTGALVQATFEPRLVAIRELPLLGASAPTAFEPEGTVLVAGGGPLATLARLSVHTQSGGGPGPGPGGGMRVVETIPLRGADDTPLRVSGLTRTLSQIFVLDAVQGKVFMFGVHGHPAGSLDLPSLQGQRAAGIYVDPATQHLWIPAVGRLREFSATGDALAEYPLPASAPPSAIGRGPQYGELAVLSAQGGTITVLQSAGGGGRTPREVLIQTTQLSTPLQVLAAQPTYTTTDPWRIVGANSSALYLYGNTPPANAVERSWRLYE